MSMKAVLLDRGTLSKDAPISNLEAKLKELGIELECHDLTNEYNQVVKRCVGAEIVITNKVVLNQQFFEESPQVKLVCLLATGFNNIDLKASPQTRNARDYCTDALVQHTFLMILGLVRQFRTQATKVKEWDKSPYFCIQPELSRDLSRMKLGIVGYGKLGKAVAGVAKAFGMEVLIAERKGVSKPRPHRTTFEEVIAKADILSLHLPLNQETEGLIGRSELFKMKQGGFLINTARGGLVEEQALVDALAEGHLAGAAIDVTRPEPPLPENPLLEAVSKMDNLIVTPHTAWISDQSVANLLDEVYANIKSFTEGGNRNVIDVP